MGCRCKYTYYSAFSALAGINRIFLLVRYSSHNIPIRNVQTSYDVTGERHTMKYIADKYLEKQGNISPLYVWISNISWSKVGTALIYGAGSVGLYSLLYHYNAELIQMAQTTHHGEKAYFFVPIVIALVFSFIHGSFTGHFWEALGIKAKP